MPIASTVYSNFLRNFSFDGLVIHVLRRIHRHALDVTAKAGISGSHILRWAEVKLSFSKELS